MRGRIISKMRVILILLSLFISDLAFTHDRGVERINFFPDAESWLIASYSHTRLEIETPEATVKTKEVHNHYNLLTLAYAHRFSHKLFAGIKFGYEEASENVATYGLPLRRRFTSTGFVNPELFLNYRLRSQKKDRGNFDAHLAIVPTMGSRKISKTPMNRFSGRNSIRMHASHGFLEEQWEFQNLVGATLNSEGPEENEFSRFNFTLESSYIIDYAFTTQYAIQENLFLSGTIGIVYRLKEVLRQSTAGEREHRSGTGSLFRLGVKRKISDWSLIDFGYSLHRSEYFIEADTFNLNGDSTSHKFQLNYVVLF